tara:strand:- start:856 stop:1113 length:258 start_codon:yes stop_codon:yes gene_type:complete
MMQDAEDPLYHFCKSCNKRVKQNLSKGYTTCVSHVKGEEETDKALTSAEANGDQGSMEWLVMDDQPFNFVDNKFFRKNTPWMWFW